MRTGISWKSIEPVKGEFHFEVFDSSLNKMLDAGFTPIIFVAVNPDWAANTYCGPLDTTNPDTLDAFSTFMYELAAHYPRIEWWALSNEPDRTVYPVTEPDFSGCFGDHITNDINGNGLNDRADYARMLAAAWKAVHSANPNARLLTGAMAYDYFDAATAPSWYLPSSGIFNYYFLPELFTYMQTHPLPDGEKYFDLLMFNHYDVFSPKWEKVSSKVGIQAKADMLDQLMSDYQLHYPMYVGESGVDSSGVGLGEQANCLWMNMVRARAYGLSGIVWWTFQDSPAINWHYGLVTDTLTPKPSYSAYQVLIRELGSLAFNRARTATTGFSSIEAHEFKSGATIKTVLWSSAIETQPAKVPCAMTRSNRTATFGSNIVKLRIVDVTGTLTNVNDNGSGDLDARVGYIAIRVGSNPLIVQSNP